MACWWETLSVARLSWHGVEKLSQLSNCYCMVLRNTFSHQIVMAWFLEPQTVVRSSWHCVWIYRQSQIVMVWCWETHSVIPWTYQIVEQQSQLSDCHGMIFRNTDSCQIVMAWCLDIQTVTDFHCMVLRNTLSYLMDISHCSATKSVIRMAWHGL